jgi:hypothetical protein
MGWLVPYLEGCTEMRPHLLTKSPAHLLDLLKPWMLDESTFSGECLMFSLPKAASEDLVERTMPLSYAPLVRKNMWLATKYLVLYPKPFGDAFFLPASIPRLRTGNSLSFEHP